MSIETSDSASDSPTTGGGTTAGATTAGATAGDSAAASGSVFASRYLAHVGTQLPNHARSELDAIARQHRQFGTVRATGQTLVRARTVDEQTSAVEIVTTDAPYLVDSVRNELRISGHPVQNLLHPQLIVSRDDEGVLSEVHDVADTADVPAGALAESWMYAEIAGATPSECAEITEDLTRVLSDVHAAVDDSTALYALIRELAQTLKDEPGQFDRETSAEAGSLLRWLADGNFMILGHVAYSANELARSAMTGKPSIDPQASGVLRGHNNVTALELLPAFRSGAPVVVFKSALMSTVLRSARYDCVTVVTPATDAEPSRVHVFLGLFTDGDDGVSRVPVLRRRIRDVIARSGARPRSYTARQLVAALRTLPRDELLEADSGDLLKLATLVSNRAERGGVGVFSRVHLNNDFVSVLVYLPVERLGPETTRLVRTVVAEKWPGSLIARDSSISDLGLARLQYLVTLRPGEPIPTPDYRDVEARITEVTRRWSDDLADLVLMSAGNEDGRRLVRRYEGAFPEAYKEDFTASTAVGDLRRLETLPEIDGLAFDLYQPSSTPGSTRRLKILRTGSHISLARVLPMLSHLGVEVVDERPYEIDRHDCGPAWIYDFGLAVPAGVDLEDRVRVQYMLDALRRIWRGDIEQDGFNALVLRAGLNWWQVTILRAYAKYLRQAGTQFSQGYIERTLTENPGIAAALVRLFEARFDPEATDPEAIDPEAIDPEAIDPEAIDPEAIDPEAIERQILDALASVPSLDQDRILRSLLGLINATLRTNAFRTDLRVDRSAEKAPADTTRSDATRSDAIRPDAIRPALAFKLDPKRINGLPEPRPAFEIWVYSPHVEGVHLRFGLIARGGLRWSDRAEDFRTEVLGLVKAQTVKNAVIVPVGAKGGFVVKRPPADLSDRELMTAEGVACYRTFISSMLDVTDNYAPGADRVVVAPERVRRYDGDDPYLVVAADKGTATFSDIANAIAVERGFWLGDAFASGGSVGYDHKAMGITARGAWESVEYHFRELGLDTQSEDFTVVGVGDMSGDVFGNGMLLSEHIRLVAAFDHRHIFLDPDPDPGRSYDERRRLFALPRSSWADYDQSLISAGGGVFARTLKSIPITATVADALGLARGTTTLTPTELMHAILLAPVDLLWNGGIGTYVKASSESNADVGDKANDGLRADGVQLRCRVVGEGGNLGCTQRGRVEFALGGGAINTDAIDNSAGVDTSDHEVNIKILLDQAVTSGRLAASERESMLAACTDEVGDVVLRNNYLQNVLLGLERRLAGSLAGVHRRLIHDLELHGGLDRALEFLPADKELIARDEAGGGLVSPELAVLAAYVKISLTARLERTTMPDEPFFALSLSRYFPRSIATAFEDVLADHPLHREIITTRVVNDMVNHAGATFVFRAADETGADVSDIALAYIAARQIFGLEQLWADIEALDNRVPTTAQDLAYFEIRRMIDRAARWLIDFRYPMGDLRAEIARFEPAVRELTPKLPDLLGGVESAALARDTQNLVDAGVPADLARRSALLLTAFLLLDVVEIAEANECPAIEVAQLHYMLSERFSVDRMLTSITGLSRDDRWSALARAALRHDVYAALAAVTTSVLRSTSPDLDAEARVKAWEDANSERVRRACDTIGEALGRENADLATLSVALRVMRTLPS